MWRLMSESTACLQIAFVSTTAEGYEQTKAWVDYHVIIGVTDFYLFVDGVAARPEVILLSSLLIFLAVLENFCRILSGHPYAPSFIQLEAHTLQHSLHAVWRVIAKPLSHVRSTLGRFQDWLSLWAGYVVSPYLHKALMCTIVQT